MKESLNPTDELRKNMILCAIDLLGKKFNGSSARQIMAAIAYQESNFFYRHQVGGPAHGFWQFEMNGGVLGVITHNATKSYARRVCAHHKIAFDKRVIFNEIEFNDELAACFARLLLWSDPDPIPIDISDCWQYYIDNWRPGKPHPDRWETSWRQAEILWG
jgi:hypothetical protein